MATKFGRQPACKILDDQRWTTRRAAREIGVKYQHLSKALRGYNTPSPKVREELPKLLNRPVEDLFTGEVLARSFGGTK